MSKITPLAAASVALLALAAAPASAACLDEVAELEQRLGRIEPQEATAGGQQQQQQAGEGDTVRMTMEGGREVQMTVEDQPEAAEDQPQENWFGSPPSREGAEDQLANAREMAETGDEQSCMEHVEQARQIIISLEE